LKDALFNSLLLCKTLKILCNTTDIVHNRLTEGDVFGLICTVLDAIGVTDVGRQFGGHAKGPLSPTVYSVARTVKLVRGVPSSNCAVTPAGIINVACWYRLYL